MSKTLVFETRKKFDVAEPVGLRGYKIHFFQSREQFEAWRKQNPKLPIIPRNQARGRQFDAIDHTNEIFDY